MKRLLAAETPNAPARLEALLVLGLLSLWACLGVTGCGGANQAAHSAPQARLSGATASPIRPAPPLRLHDYRGRPVDLQQYRGKAVFVTFIYTHCPDTCPLIVSHMRTVQALLGKKSSQIEVLAVSTDPRGDTPTNVERFLRKREMLGRMEYLIGSRAELGRVWKAWHIVAKPAGAGRDLVEHSALVYGISGSGKLATLYPSNFGPRQIAHDAPLLARR